MIRVVNESAGDIILHKFILIQGVRFYISDNSFTKKQIEWIRNKCNVKGD